MSPPTTAIRFATSSPPSVAANDESSVEKDVLFQLSEQEDGVNSNDSSMIEEYSEIDMGDHQDSAAADE